MNMYMCMKINYINSSFIKLKVMASLCSHYFIGYAGLPRRTTGNSGLNDSISEQYNFLTSAMEIRVCQNPGVMHDSMLSDVHIGENAPPPAPCIITEWPPFTIHVINVMFRPSNN